MTFGVETDEAGSHEQLDRFVEAGGTLVDTADVYGGGQSEEIIGRWFAEPTSRCHRARGSRDQRPVRHGSGTQLPRALNPASDASAGRVVVATRARLD